MTDPASVSPIGDVSTLRGIPQGWAASRLSSVGMAQATDSFGSFNDVGAQALADAEIVCSLRYQYNLGSAEISRLHAAGVGVGMIGEYDTLTWHPVLSDYWTGRNHAADTVGKLRARGFPPGCVAWATADTGVSPANYQLTVPYMTGWSEIVRAAGYQSGLYGGEGLVDWVHGVGLIDAGWGAGATSWNYGHWSTWIVLRQRVGTFYYGGTAVDLNDVLGDCGHWDPGAPPIQEDELTMADIQVLLDKIDALALGELALALNTSRSHTAYQVEGDDAIFYLADGPAGTPTRVHIPSPPMVAALQTTGYLNAAITALTHADHQALIDALATLPQVEFNP